MTNTFVSAILEDQNIAREFRLCNENTTRAEQYFDTAVLRVANHAETVAKPDVKAACAALAKRGDVKNADTLAKRVSEARTIIRKNGGTLAGVAKAIVAHNSTLKPNAQPITTARGLYKATAPKVAKVAKVKPAAVTATVVVDSHNVDDLTDDALLTVIETLTAAYAARKAKATKATKATKAKAA